MTVDTIHCFYLDLGWQQHAELVPYWETRWQREGWKTRVLTLDDAKSDPRYDQMLSKADAMPCVNDRLFERANFIRWLAFSHVDGAVADYDVFPIKPFPPKSFDGFCHGDPSGGPGFIVGRSNNFCSIADDILAYAPKPADTTNGLPHVSDMVVLHHDPHLRYERCLHVVKGYLDPGWQQASLVHFSNNSMLSIPGSKLEKIQTIIKEEYPEDMLVKQHGEG